MLSNDNKPVLAERQLLCEAQSMCNTKQWLKTHYLLISFLIIRLISVLVFWATILKIDIALYGTDTKPHLADPISK